MNLEPSDVEYEFSDGWGPFGFGRVIDHHDSNGHRIVVDDNGNEHDIDDHDWGPDFAKVHSCQESEKCVCNDHDCDYEYEPRPNNSVNYSESLGDISVELE